MLLLQLVERSRNDVGRTDVGAEQTKGFQWSFNILDLERDVMRRPRCLIGNRSMIEALENLGEPVRNTESN